MDDQCSVDNMQRECPLSADFAVIKHRIEILELEQEKEENFRALYEQEQRKRIERDTKIDEKLSTIQADLTNITTWIDEQKNKPQRMLDDTIKDVIKLILAVLVGYVAARLGLQ